MRNIRLIVVLTLCMFVVAMANPTKPFYDVAEGPQLFQKFKEDHKKVYKDEADEKVHYDVFLESLKQINELNAKSTSATYGINKFADYTDEEKQQMHGLKIKKN